MDFLEICLIIAGIVCIVASFVFSGNMAQNTDTKSIKASASDLESIKKQIDSMVKERVDAACEGTEITMEKLSNRKIMEINEYSDTVLAQIKSNHDEALFLYDMLNKKSSSLKQDVDIKLEDFTFDKPIVNLQPITKEPTKAAAPQNKKQNKNKNKQITSDEQAFSQMNRQRKMSPNKDQILELCAQGYSSVDIAKKLGIGIGEVRLVVDLYRGE